MFASRRPSGNRRASGTPGDPQRKAVIRLRIVMVLFVAGFAGIGVQMGRIALFTPSATFRAYESDTAISSARRAIEDRKGRVLAMNMKTHSLYAHPDRRLDPQIAAQRLGAIFPDLSVSALERKFNRENTFAWVKRSISPEQMQTVLGLGEPGLLFGRREMRFYPNGPIAAHVLGGARLGQQSVHAAEVLGRGGVEAFYDADLRDTTHAPFPLRLSLDLTIQTITEHTLEQGMRELGAKGAAAVMMDIHTGEVLALASLPDFDPNDTRRAPLGGTQADAGIAPAFNRAVQGAYEMGSVFKLFTIAQALELNLIGPHTQIDVRGPVRIDGLSVRDSRDLGTALSVHDVLVRSSNVGTAQIARLIGGARQREFLKSLGLMDATGLEVHEARRMRALFPEGEWRRDSALTISYGYGLSTSVVHVATAFATLANGGRRVYPTLHPRRAPVTGVQVVSPEVSRALLAMLRDVVQASHGTARPARIGNLDFGGKTGTAHKLDKRGEYDDERVIAIFAGVFPMDAPRHVLVVMLDEPEDRTGPEPRRSAGVGHPHPDQPPHPPRQMRT